MLNLKKLFVLAAVAGIFFAAAAAPANVVKLKLNKADGIYTQGEKIEVSITCLNGRTPVAPAPANVIILNQDRTQKVQYFEKAPEKFIFTADRSPYAYQISVELLSADKKPLFNGKGKRKVPVRASIGAIVDPQKYTTGFTEPADFQKFWDNAKADLAKIPLKVLERKEMKLDNSMLETAPNYFAFRIVAEMPQPKELVGKFKSWDVKVACVDNVPVSGYLTMPANAKPKSLPVIVSFLGAPGASARQAFADDVIRFDVNPHGFENGHPREYYKNKHATTHRHYAFRNYGDRNKYYFRGMFLRVVRALEFVKSLPEYDGKTLIVVGNSQGGAQSLVAAGLDPDVKLVYASVPAMCDHGAILVKRRAGWPRLVNVTKAGVPNRPDVAATVPYYDCAFFAKRIKAEAYLATGLIDDVCSPTSVFTAYNNIPGKKHISVFPAKGHSRTFSLKFNARLLEVINAVKQANR